MGRFDRRKSMKMRRRAGQATKKARERAQREQGGTAKKA
jgi:hypothetical protein